MSYWLLVGTDSCYCSKVDLAVISLRED